MPACGAALAVVYGNALKELQSKNKLGDIKTVLVIVCGGQGVSFQQLLDLKSRFDL